MSEPAALALAVEWTERLTALALVLQTVELLAIRRAWSDDGIWRWTLLAPEQRALVAPVRWLCAGLLPARPFGALLWLRLCAALALGAGAAQGVAVLLLFTQLAIGVRFRGTFNGGSDTMSVVLLCALSCAQLLPASVLAREAALLYVAVQLTLSYLLAGLGKLQHAEWRSGRALAGFLERGRYGTPGWLLGALAGETRRRVLSWCVLIFECTFPLAWSGARAAAIFAALGLCFHIGNWLLFGLNRFVFAWAAAYPALLWCSTGLR
jgi:hypothetical protein